MKNDEFVKIFSELIQTDMALDLTTPLASVEEWDSMAIMAFIAWLDVEYGVHINFEQLENLETVGDLAKLVPDFSNGN